MDLLQHLVNQFHLQSVWGNNMAVSNAEVVINGQELSSADQVQELQDFLDESQDERIIRTKTGSAEIYLKDDAVCITSQGSNGIIVNQYGTTVDGKFHIAQDPNNIRVAGFWTLNNELLTTLPSTIYTPIPVLVYDEPPAIQVVQGYVSYLGNLA